MSFNHHSSDESIQPAYGGNWFDGGRFLELHYHTYNKDNPLLNGNWNYFSNMIGVSNQILFILRSAPEGQAKKQSIAEMQTMRAFAYWGMMDLFGNVPIDTAYGCFIGSCVGIVLDMHNCVAHLG